MNVLALTCSALEAHGVSYAVIGATALAVHGVTLGVLPQECAALWLRSVSRAP